MLSTLLSYAENSKMNKVHFLPFRNIKHVVVRFKQVYNISRILLFFSGSTFCLHGKGADNASAVQEVQ